MRDADGSSARCARIWLIVACSAVSFGAAAPPVGAYASDEPTNDDYLTAYLKWKDGKGGLRSDPDAATEDYAGPPEPTDALEKNKQPLYSSAIGLSGVGLRPIIGSNPLVLPPVEFVGEPLPNSLYVNVSRKVRVDLFVSGCSGTSNTADPQFSVEIRADTKFFAGAQYASNVLYSSAWKTAAPTPKVPPGHCLRTFRMQAELDTLPAGTVLTLTVIPESQSKWHQFGASKDRRSILQIPYFPPEEAVFRVPELSTVTGSEARSEPSALPMAAFATIPLLAASGRGNRGGRFLAGALVLLMFGGCLGGPAEGEASGRRALGGSAKSTIVEDRTNATGLANRTAGSLAGSVHDSLGLPVAGAHASVLTTDRFSETNNVGQFTIPNLPVGRYSLRVDRAGFRGFEGPFTIVANSITRMEILLESVDPRAGDFKPHRHDRWGGQERITILEDTVRPSGGVAQFTLPTSKLILPGTRDVEITLTWQMSWLRRAAISFTANQEGLDWTGWSRNDSVLYPREKGVLFHIRTSREMTDLGHHQVSTWDAFRIVPARFESNYANLAQRTAEPLQYSVKVTIIKGLVPFEAAHDDYWQGSDRLVLLSNAGQECCTGGSSGFHGWRPKPLVPPGTGLLEIVLNQSKETYQTYELKARFGNMRSDTDPEDYRILEADESGPLQKKYRLQLKPEEADPFYAPMSNWFFLAEPGRDDDLPVSALGCSSYQCVLDTALSRDLQFTLSVVAHRDPASA